MAGDWIKMRKDLEDDPAVVGVASTLGVDEFAVVGRLHKLWGWADSHTVDGNASSVTGALAVSWIDRYLGLTGFADALISVGWLVVDDSGVHLPNFDRHNGETAKQRALTAKRVAKTKVAGNAKGNATSVTLPLPVALPREEKRREEEIQRECAPPASNETSFNPPTPADSFELAEYKRDRMLYVTDFVRLWNALDGVSKYPRNTLDALHERMLLDRLTDPAWHWRQAFAKFPLAWSDSIPPPSLDWLLQPASVLKILTGKYERPTGVANHGRGRRGPAFGNGPGQVFTADAELGPV